jgi:hypothetical protein
VRKRNKVAWGQEGGRKPIKKKKRKNKKSQRGYTQGALPIKKELRGETEQVCTKEFQIETHDISIEE